MKLICETAKQSGLPGESLLLLFTKSAWLTKRPIFQSIRNHILGSFEHVTGALVQANEFFDVKGSWPVAFTVWRYKGQNAGLNANRSLQLVDLTWVTKRDLANIAWNDPDQLESACRTILESKKSHAVTLGLDRASIREWYGGAMIDFKRDRRKSEKDIKVVGGLPANDRRQANKKAYGEVDGKYIGFMDDLTPCRVKNATIGKPWLNLDNRFMAVKKSRCFSGPPTHLGYCAQDLASAKKLFFWYALGRTFVQRPYPTWIDADGMWAPNIPDALACDVYHYAFAIAFAENECIDAHFPANNPTKGAPELFVGNPMTPLDQDSYWSRILLPFLKETNSRNVSALIKSVNNVFKNWKDRFKTTSEIPTAYSRPYFAGEGKLLKTAGLLQIKDYAIETDDAALQSSLAEVQNRLKIAKNDFFEIVTEKLGYFGENLASGSSRNLKEYFVEGLHLQGSSSNS
jgi:hypothetical protein